MFGGPVPVHDGDLAHAGGTAAGATVVSSVLTSFGVVGETMREGISGGILWDGCVDGECCQREEGEKGDHDEKWTAG